MLGLFIEASNMDYVYFNRILGLVWQWLYGDNFSDINGTRGLKE